MEILGEASVVEGRQVEQVFTKDRELKFNRPTRNEQCKMLKGQKGSSFRSLFWMQTFFLR
jgi:hypothetical protein